MDRVDDTGDTGCVSFIALSERAELAGPQTQPSDVLRTQFDAVLVAAQAGAEWAWTLLYRSLSGKVLGYLKAHGADDPEDLLGEVFLQVARNIAGFSGDEAAFRSWVFVVAHHRILDERRRRRRRPTTLVGDVPDQPDWRSHDETMAGLSAADVRATLDVLTPQQRDVVLLRVFGDLTLDEVSVVVDRPVSAVKALQRRAYARLRKNLGRDPYPDDPSRR